MAERTIAEKMKYVADKASGHASRASAYRCIRNSTILHLGFYAPEVEELRRKFARENRKYARWSRLYISLFNFHQRQKVAND